MCTLSVIRHAGVRRFMMNRDEAHTRPSAQKPQLIRYNGGQACYPIDPPHGTWFGCNDSGLVAALLNLNQNSEVTWKPTHTPQSRGEIIPRVLQQNTTKIDAIFDDNTLKMYAPFKLILCNAHKLDEYAWNGHTIKTTHHPDFSTPGTFRCCWASSGLGDHAVQQKRYPLFTKMTEEIFCT